METNQAPSSELFCWNDQCPDHRATNHANIRKFGQTKRGTQRYQCKTCKHTFVVSRGTIFYGRHHSDEAILHCLAMLARQNSWAEIERVQGVKRGTVLNWLREAAQHQQAVEELLRDRSGLDQAQLDRLWRHAARGSEPAENK